jgi:hypothetical protein
LNFQATLHLGQRKSIRDDPGENLADHFSSILVDLDPGDPASGLAVDVAVAERGPPEHAHRSRAGRVQLASTIAFLNFRAFIFGDDALNLEQEVALGGGVVGMVEEDQLDAGPPELVDEQRLMSKAACQPIGTEDIKPIDPACGHQVAEPLQRGTDQDRSTDTLVGESERLIKDQAIGGDPLAKGIDLTVDGLLANLLLGRDPGIESRTNTPVFSHDVSFLMLTDPLTSSVESAGGTSEELRWCDEGTIFS